MGMGIFFSGAAMRSPAGVADAKGAHEGMLAENLFKVGKLAGGAANLESRAGWAADRDACRVVAAILEPPQPFDNDGNYFLRTYITDNAAHGTILSEGSGARPPEMRHSA
jgi:hypothetical protein